MGVALRRLRILASALLLVLFAFGTSEGMALAQSDPSAAEYQAFAKQEAKAAFACPAAASARAAHRRFFTLAEAKQCAPGAAVSDTGRFTVELLPNVDLTGYSQTQIVRAGFNEYLIMRLTNLDGLGRASRTVRAAGCPEISTWNQGGWGPTDVYINNQTRWYRYWSDCGGSSPQAAWAFINPTCSSFWPWSVNSCSPTGYNDWTTDVYTDVTGIYGCFCASATLNAWQEMYWNGSNWVFYGWETGN